MNDDSHRISVLGLNTGNIGRHIIYLFNSNRDDELPTLEVKKNIKPNFKNRNGSKGRNRFKY